MISPLQAWRQCAMMVAEVALDAAVGMPYGCLAKEPRDSSRAS